MDILKVSMLTFIEQEEMHGQCIVPTLDIWIFFFAV